MKIEMLALSATFALTLAVQAQTREDLNKMSNEEVRALVIKRGGDPSAFRYYSRMRQWLEPAQTPEEIAKLKAQAASERAALAQEQEANRATGVAEAQKDATLEGLKVVSRHWTLGGFDLVSMITLTVKNVTKRPIGNIRYSTTYYSETLIPSHSLGGAKIIEKLVQPGQTRTFEINDGYIDKDKTSKMHFQIEGYDIL